mmetsp:Transcript_20686/g.20803  ORF Transcript_20686/g.20803 Transcript_20686/m.20803 type:complete len:248 (+) Transcript_20686:120-863(+)
MYRFSAASILFATGYGVYTELSHRRSRCESIKDNLVIKEEKKKLSSIIFLGSGSSTGNPHPYFLMTGHPLAVKAAQGNPADNKNYRCNPSILIQYQAPNSPPAQDPKNIIIDVGKTFREAIIRWIPRHGIRSVDSVLLTHGHADAIFGLDDIRGVMPVSPERPMRVYLSSECYHTIRQVLYYLVPSNDTMTYKMNSETEGEIKEESEREREREKKKNEDGYIDLVWCSEEKELGSDVKGGDGVSGYL